MKLRKGLLLGVSMAVMAAPAVFAAEAETEMPAEMEESLGGVLTALFGEDGVLAEALPEDADIDAMIDTAQQQLEQADKEVSEVVEGLNSLVENELDKLDLDSETIKEYGSAILDLLGGGEDMDLDSETIKEYGSLILGLLGGGEEELDLSYLDQIFERNEKINAAEEAYLLEYHEGSMDFGDVQIVSNNSIHREDDEYDSDVNDREPFKRMSLMIQSNFDMDEENQLWLVSGATDVVLFTHQQDENGEYLVTDAVFAEDGEGYAASVEAMAAEVGESMEECQEAIETGEVMYIYDLYMYLDQHPEVKGIEYAGDIRTADEIMDLWGEALEALEPDAEGLEALESETEEGTE